MGLFKSKKEKMYEKAMDKYYHEYFSLFYNRRLLMIELKKINKNQENINKEYKENTNKTDKNFVLLLDKWFTDHIPSSVLTKVLSSIPVKFEDNTSGIKIFANLYLTGKDLSQFKGVIPTTIEEFYDSELTKYYLIAKDGRKSDTAGYLNYINEFKRLNKEIDDYSAKILAMCKEITSEFNYETEKLIRDQISKDVDLKVESEGCKNG